MTNNDSVHITLPNGGRCEIWINGKLMGYAAYNERYKIRALYRVEED